MKWYQFLFCFREKHFPKYISYNISVYIWFSKEIWPLVNLNFCSTIYFDSRLFTFAIHFLLLLYPASFQFRDRDFYDKLHAVICSWFILYYLKRGKIYSRISIISEACASDIIEKILKICSFGTACILLKWPSTQ